MIRPTRPDDDVRALGASHGPDQDEPRRRVGLVAEADGEVIGSATASWSTRHPDCVRADISVLPTQRRRGVGRSLALALRARVGQSLFAFASSADPASLALAASIAAADVNDSVTERVHLEDIAATPLREPPVLLEPGPDLLDDEICEVFESVYAERHRWAGRYVPTPGKPWITFAGDVVPGTVVLARDSAGRVVGASCVQHGAFDEGSDGFLAPTGLVGGEDAAGTVEEMVRRSLLAARAAGLRRVTVEHDRPYAGLRRASAQWRGERVSELTVWRW